MFKHIEETIALNYIRKNMGHGTTDERNRILQAINKAMSEQYSEANLITWFSSLITLLTINNFEIRKMSMLHGLGSNFIKSLTEVASLSVQEALDAIVAVEKERKH